MPPASDEADEQWKDGDVSLDAHERRRRQIIMSQQPGKKCLSQVFGILPAVSLPAHKGIEGIPVDPAQLLQRSFRPGIFFSCRDDHGPMGFIEPADSSSLIEFG